MLHCVKSVLYSEFFRSVFFHIWTEYEDLLCKYPYSGQMLENTDQKNSDTFHTVLFCRIKKPYTATSDTLQTIYKFSKIFRTVIFKNMEIYSEAYL